MVDVANEDENWLYTVTLSLSGANYWVTTAIVWLDLKRGDGVQARGGNPLLTGETNEDIALRKCPGARARDCRHIPSPGGNSSQSATYPRNYGSAPTGKADGWLCHRKARGFNCIGFRLQLRAG